MSKKQPVRVRVRSEYIVEPQEVYTSKVTKSGSGAAIKSFKRFIGREALIIMTKEKQDILANNLSF